MKALSHTNQAKNHAHIVAVETEKEWQHRLEYLEESRINWVTRTHQASQTPIENEESVVTHHCGKMNLICQYCGARYIIAEKPENRKFSLCCYKKKLILLPQEFFPELLYRLLMNSHPKSPYFMQLTKNYNNPLAFASMRA